MNVKMKTWNVYTFNNKDRQGKFGCMKIGVVLMLCAVAPLIFAQDAEIDDIRHLAFIGNTYAQAILGKHYAYGYLVDKSSDSLAQEQYRKSADENDPLGLAYDACFIEWGRGGYPKDVAAARKQFKKSLDNGLFELAQNGNTYAQDMYGILLAFGAGGLTQNPQEGLEWREKAANAGNPFAQYEVGHLYRRGNDTYKINKDTEEALKYLRMAAAQGFPRAQDYVANLSWDEAAAQARTKTRHGNMFVFKGLYLGMPINDACQTLNKHLNMLLGVGKDEYGRLCVELKGKLGNQDINIIADSSGNVSFFYFKSNVVSQLFGSGMTRDEFVQNFINAYDIPEMQYHYDKKYKEGWFDTIVEVNNSYWIHRSPKGFELRLYEKGDMKLWKIQTAREREAKFD